MNTNKPGIVFDLDGTLIDSTRDITRAINSVLEANNLPPVQERDVRNAIGHGGEALVEELIEDYDNPGSVSALLSDFRVEYQQHCTNNITPYDGITELVKLFKNSFTAIVTNKPQSMTEAILDEIGWMDLFDPIYGADSHDQMKPSPVPLNSVKQHWPDELQNLIMVGDTWSDVEAGNKAGLTTIGCQYGLGSLENSTPDFIAESPDDIRKILNQINPSSQ